MCFPWLQFMFVKGVGHGVWGVGHGAWGQCCQGRESCKDVRVQLC